MNAPVLAVPLPSLDPAQARRALEGLPVALVLVGADGRLGWRNARFDALFDDAALDVASLAARAEGSPRGVAARVRRRAGGFVDVRVTNVPCGLGRMLSLDDAPAAQVARMQARLEETEDQRMLDPVSGAWSRRYLDRIVTTEIIRSRRYRHPLSAAVVAIDRLDRVVGGHGLAAVDSLAREVAGRLSASVRMADTVCRWDGTAFLVLMPYATYRGARIACERMRAAIATHPLPGAGKVTASIGVAELAPDEDASGLFGRAGTMLRAARDAGGDQVACDASGASAQWAAAAARAPLKLEWNDAYACGHAGLDAGRRELFRLCNHLLGASLRNAPVELAAALEHCIAHLGIHFEREENVLAQMEYAGLANHHGMHQALLARARDIEARVRVDGPVAGDLMAFLCLELVARHILVDDCEYFALTERAAAGPPRASKVLD